jgi:hypothetical protein
MAFLVQIAPDVWANRHPVSLRVTGYSKRGNLLLYPGSVTPVALSDDLTATDGRGYKSALFSDSCATFQLGDCRK